MGACKVAELSQNSYQPIWNTGEVLDVTNNSTYFNLSSWLSPIDDPGSTEGLLVSDIDPDAWRVTNSTSLFNPIPEPAILGLLSVGMGLTALSKMRRRRVPTAQ